ncbi:hypothetical protein CtesDRAFT_PD1581 [Comamonas testosteroni KF-1]|uniref:Uncharacterized protein n=1 Tax=Comamonas testosteroni (strain DSM 14576 / KF-1) TaxID=399795 RepID=B7X2S3_COMTK|nr:hypothetical protein CtesDRAFT_PD1581 [Comamonas testosteroni KF-1]
MTLWQCKLRNGCHAQPGLYKSECAGDMVAFVPGHWLIRQARHDLVQKQAVTALMRYRYEALSGEFGPCNL